MVKLEEFEISFSNRSGIFYAGSIVEGHVTVLLNEPMKMRGIRLKFIGKAEVSWIESRTERSSDAHGDFSDNVSNSAQETYFDQEMLLYGVWPGQESDTGNTELHEGRHTFPFTFQLPPSTPSSFECDIGHVRHTAKCNIDKPWKFDHITKRVFTVINILDLNSNPHCAQRIEAHKIKNLCCLCCKTGPIEASFHIERYGWVPGEAIKLYAEIVNGTNRRISKTYITLRMKTVCHARTRSKSFQKELVRITRPSIRPRSEDSWNGEEMVIPPLPPSFLHGCDIIDIRYILQLSVDPSGVGNNLEVPLDIIIGNVPLVSKVTDYPSIAPQSSDRSLAHDVMYPPPPQTSLPNLPPPSYGEFLSGKVNIKEDDDEHTRGDKHYTPVYMYYNLGHTAAPNV